MFEAQHEDILRLHAVIRSWHRSERPISLLDLTPGRGQLAWSLWRMMRPARVQMMAQVGGAAHAALLATAERARAHLGPVDGPTPLLVNDPRRPSGTRGLAGYYDVLALSALRGCEALLPVLRAVCWRWLVLLSAGPDWPAGRAAGLERVDLLRVQGAEAGRPHAAYFSVWRRAEEVPAPLPVSTADVAGTGAVDLEADLPPDASFFQPRAGLDGHAAYADYAPTDMLQTRLVLGRPVL